MPPRPEYRERFAVDRAGYLVRTVVPQRGKRYQHRCPKGSFQEVAWAADAMVDGITIERIVAQTSLPSTHVAVALAFMKERGCVMTVGRLSYSHPGTGPGQISLDAMLEYYALAEGSPGSAQPALTAKAEGDTHASTT